MRILATADWHIGVTHHGVDDDNGRNSRSTDLEATLMQMVDIACDQDVDLFVCAGDIFHTNRPSLEDQRVFWRLLSRLRSRKIQSRFIIGNHDYNSKLGSSHALKLYMDVLAGDEYIKIHDRTGWEAFSDRELSVCYFPYRGSEPDWTWGHRCQERDDNHKVAVVCHSHLEGAVVGAEPFEIKDDNVTKFSDLPVDYVIAGHFHKPQVLSTKPLAFYPGSPQCVDFSERNDSKGVVILDTEIGKQWTVPVDTRKFVQIDLEGPYSSGDVTRADLEGAVVKVNISLTADQAKSVDEEGLRDHLISLGAHNVTAINLIIDRGSNVRDSEMKLDNSMADNFKRFVSSKDYGPLQGEVISKGLEIIESCQPQS
jgi:DNA repair exonuclease SbcCD nuclease subunit